MWGNLAGFLPPVIIGHILEWTHADSNLTLNVSAAEYLTGILCWSRLDSLTPIKQ
jgi:hypothetical protein